MSEFVGSAICLSFKRELFEAVHDFRLDTFNLALYTPQATIDENTTAYTEVGELPSLNGYLTGGQSITIDPPLLVGRTALVPFETLLWTPATFRARRALCYNATKPGLPAVFVLDFGMERQPNGINFAVQFLGSDPNGAIVRLL